MIREAFKEYRASGLTCLPIKKGDKTPAMSSSWKNGCDDESLYQYGVGIVCGQKSGGLECMDFDNHFGDAKDVFGEFLDDEVQEICNRNVIPFESTMSGGYHLLYRCSEVGPNQKLAQRPKVSNGKTVPDTIIEIRGEGGYFVCAPTDGYSVMFGNISEIPEITPSERLVLIEKAKSLNEWYEIEKTKKHDSEIKDKPGDYYNNRQEAIEEMRGALIRAGWEEVDHKRWRRPGKTKGISATLGVVAPNVFYCFTPNAYPFEQDSGYSPFRVVGLLDYGGDFTELAKDIIDRYNLGGPKERSVNDSPVVAKEEKTGTELDGILRKAEINLDIPVTNPPIVLKIFDQEGIDVVEKRLFTLGNFSCITGKSKSKKTFLTSLLMASAVKNDMIQGKFVSDFPDNKRTCLLFDTEQSGYDAFVSAIRVRAIAGGRYENFRCFDLREYSPIERCSIIDYALKKYSKSIGYVVIDGIADLAKAINDEEEASRVSSLLMYWTKIYNCHITVVIHQNKQDNYATGHLGSSIIKKAECVISVNKTPNNYKQSAVSCDLIRGTGDFNDFEFFINNESLPEVIQNIGEKNSTKF